MFKYEDDRIKIEIDVVRFWSMVTYKVPHTHQERATVARFIAWMLTK